MVVLTGDIVDTGYDPSQWVNANASMNLLLKAGIPYSWDAGNHDQISADGGAEGNPDGDWIGSQYLAFNSTYMESQPYWVSDINDGKNTAVQFSYGNYNCLIINLEFHANQMAIDWMTNLINTHQNYNIVIATHSYLNGAQGYGYPGSIDSPQWENDLTNILNCYPNVFLTMSGHCVPMDPYPQNSTAETSNYTNVNGREETFFNRQDVGEGEGGPEADSARIFTFNMTEPNDVTIQASTFDIYDNAPIDDSWNLFSFPTDLTNATTPVTPLPTPTPPPSPTANPSIPSEQTLIFSVNAASTPKPTINPTPKPTATPTPTPKPLAKPTATPKPIQAHKQTAGLTHKNFNRIHLFLKSLVQRLLSHFTL